MIDSNPEIDCLGELDSRAVTAVYNQYFPEIFRYVKYRLGDDCLAEDITSEAFLSLLNSIKGGNRPEKNLRGWLIGAARHMVIDHIRHKYRHPGQAVTEELQSPAASPCEQVEQRDASHSLHLALVHLTEDQQQVLALRFGQGYSLEETAGIMKKKVNAVKALQFRALAALQNRFGAQAALLNGTGEE